MVGGLKCWGFGMIGELVSEFREQCFRGYALCSR